MTTNNKTIICRVDEPTKQAFSDIAKHHGLTESEYLRTIVLNEINKPSDTPKLKTTEAKHNNIEMSYLKIRLPKFLINAAKEKANAHGMVTTRWIKSLVQSNLIQTPVLFDNLLLAVKESNRELAAVGNNLNQIARKLNESSFNTDQVKIEKLEEVNHAVQLLRAELKNLIRISQDAWK